MCTKPGPDSGLWLLGTVLALGNPRVSLAILELWHHSEMQSRTVGVTQ
jgi:hypothetical protein